jgi:folylpolyglutamate synthase/dihydropteroate synthase
MSEIPLSDIGFDQDIYPRERINRNKIMEYVETLKSGSTFPPITLQKICYPGKEDKPEYVKLVILDGAHRTEAYKKFNEWAASEENTGKVPLIENVPYVLHSETVYHKDSPKHVAELLLIAARYNSSHGYQMNNEDKQQTAKLICKADPSHTTPNHAS